MITEIMVGVVIVVVQLVIGIIAWFSKRTIDSIDKKQDAIEKVQAETLKEVRLTNGRVTRLEQQVRDHNDRDDDRFDSLEHRIREALQR